MISTYTMVVFFSGRGEQLGHAKPFVASRASGRVLGMSTDAKVGDEGSLQIPAAIAHFDTIVMARDDQTWEAGRVEFPEIDSYLDVETYTPGRVQNLPDGSCTGSIAWQVTGGGGKFAGASGIVTGNFVGYPDGTFTDHQLFKLVLPDSRPA
jgi:hypothetical protein